MTSIAMGFALLNHPTGLLFVRMQHRFPLSAFRRRVPESRSGSRHMNKVMLGLVLLVGATVEQTGNAQILDVIHELHINESGSFIIKTTKEMNTREFQVLASVVCAYYGVPPSNCTKYIAAVQQGAKVLSSAASGRNHYITGEITRHDPGSEAWAGIFRAPVGYTICNAGIFYGQASVDGESSFSSQILRGTKDWGLGFYTVVPKNRKEGHWVEYYALVRYVKADPGWEARYKNCAPTGSTPWDCKGHEPGGCNALTRDSDIQ
jgi:hypothetical protein